MSDHRAWHWPWQRQASGAAASTESQPSPDSQPAALARKPTQKVISALGPGQQIGPFHVIKAISQGGMATVFGAIDLRTEEACVIKTILVPPGSDEQTLRDAQDRFLREARAAERLHHPDIVRIFESGEFQGIPYLAMELVSGRDLRHYTAAARLLPLPILRGVLERVALALDYAHRQGVVHRDVKPANVMVDWAKNQVKVMDFGVARLDDASQTRTGLMLGSPAYMPPEQLAGLPVDARSDIYALGVMAFEMLTGHLPFQSHSMGELMRQINQTPPPDVRLLRPDVPKSVVGWLNKALAKAQAERFSTAQEMAQALAEAPPNPGKP